MGFDFRFRLVTNRKDLTNLVNFLIKQSLGYPCYEDWVQRAEAEIEGGYKTAILGFSNDYLVADLIFQQHKELPNVREVKNIRVHPDFRRRDFAHFMLRQAEAESPNYQAIICDVRADRPEAIMLLRFSGYVPIVSVPLYDKKVSDVVMIKCFDKATESGLTYRSKQIILGKAV